MEFFCSEAWLLEQKRWYPFGIFQFLPCSADDGRGTQKITRQGNINPWDEAETHLHETAQRAHGIAAIMGIKVQRGNPSLPDCHRRNNHATPPIGLPRYIQLAGIKSTFPGGVQKISRRFRYGLHDRQLIGSELIACSGKVPERDEQDGILFTRWWVLQVVLRWPEHRTRT